MGPVLLAIITVLAIAAAAWWGRAGAVAAGRAGVAAAATADAQAAAAQAAADALAAKSQAAAVAAASASAADIAAAAAAKLRADAVSNPSLVSYTIHDPDTVWSFATVDCPAPYKTLWAGAPGCYLPASQGAAACTASASCFGYASINPAGDLLTPPGPHVTLFGSAPHRSPGFDVATYYEKVASGA